MLWKKRGVIWKPDGHLWWARGYATCPTPFFRKNGALRIYIQCRDENNVGRIGYVDLDPDDPMRVLKISTEPVLDVGKPGAFDDNGVFQTSVIRAQNGQVFMYYVGFELCHHVRYRLLTGLAISDDDGETYRRIRSTPILERSPEEMHIRGGAYIISTESDTYRMWYVAGSDWEEIDGKMMPVYDIRYAESHDGITWPACGQVIMELERNVEHGLGRPYVVETEKGFLMFYSIRKISPRAYRMGYAESEDGVTWVRKDSEVGLDVSTHGWDSEAIEYPAIIESNGKIYCFYNGNNFGAAGFGVAELIE